MRLDLWSRLRPAFHSAVDMSRAHRDELIANLFAQDAELGSELKKLLAAHDDETVDGNVLALFGLGQVSIPVALAPGQLLLDRFEIVRLLGSGGMGDVYEALDLELGQRIAIKTLAGRFAADARALSLLKSEVQVARQVTTRNACRINEFLTSPTRDGAPGLAFITMELLEGITLAEKLEQSGRMPWKEVRRIALDICAGLAEIHSSKIVHRDLKPRNVMLVERQGRETAVLMDFGIAQETTSSGAESGSAGMAGTLAYMAPEQFEGRAVSPATDIYAMGVMLYELLTGSSPFPSGSPIEAAVRRASHPKPISAQIKGIPRHWDRVISRCLEFEPELRFQSASELARSLSASPNSPDNLRHDRPLLFAAACAVPIALACWASVSYWQMRQIYTPNADALHWYQTGLTALHEGTYVRAVRSFEESIARDPQFPMAHARLAEALANLDFQSDAQRELLIAMPHGSVLSPLDRLYVKAIGAIVAENNNEAIATYTRILAKIPAGQKAIGNLDLGIAYERSGDIDRALKQYQFAETLDASSPAPYMRVGILESRLLNATAANQAFDSAEKLFNSELNQEGLAELHYEQGYAHNVLGQPAPAKVLLRQALEEATRIDSVQLQVRSLTQISNVDYIISTDERSPESLEADEMIDRAERLARDHRLDSWLADGLVRRANILLLKGKVQQAEATVREAIVLATETRQLRVNAMADLTLASIMNQERQPDKIIAPAKDARDYYQRHGFLNLAEFSSLLITRAERDQGRYADALQASLQTLEIANRTGIRRLIMQSEETVGSVLVRMDRYPEAIPHFGRAAADADRPDEKGQEIIAFANALWQLGRYEESDSALASLPQVPEVQQSGLLERISSLISRRKFAEAAARAAKAEQTAKDMTADFREELEWGRGIAIASRTHRAENLKRLRALLKPSRTPDEEENAERALMLASAELNAGYPADARDDAATAQKYFRSEGRPQWELQATLVEGAACNQLHDTAGYAYFLKISVDLRSRLEHIWDTRSLTSFLNRPDIRLSASISGISASHP
jgi:tetratricopeptide (TPR) repeat protein